MVIRLATLTKNTFTETIRQPVYLIILCIGLLAIAISPSLTMYSMEDDNKMLRELGFSTLLLSGLFIAVFSAATVMSEEFENKTIITVLSKPVQRPVFILGKFLGVCGGILLAHYILTAAFLLSVRHGVLETASDTSDPTVLIAAGIILVIPAALSAFLNYSYDWKFSSTVTKITAVLLTVIILILVFIDRDFKFNPQKNGFHILDIYASVLIAIATISIASLAIVFATRLNIVLTLIACLCVFMLGLISNYMFGRFADSNIFAKIAYFTLPNIQVFWISDAIYEKSMIDAGYIGICAAYGLCFSGAMLALAIGLFQTRQAD